MVTKQEAYEKATLLNLAANPMGTRMDVIYLAMDGYAKQQSIAFYEWARVYNMSHMTEHLQAGKLPTVEELWEKYEQSQK